MLVLILRQNFITFPFLGSFKSAEFYMNFGTVKTEDKLY